MKKAGIVVLALFLAPALFAQQSQQPPAQPEQWAAVTCYVPTQAAPTAQPQAQTPAPQMPKRPHPLDPADVEAITGRPYQGAAWGKAPKPGHPLDWTDVEILTGRARGSNGYSGSAYGAAPYVYVQMDGQMYGSRYGSPYGARYGSWSGSWFGGDVFAPITTQTRPLFAPRVFRRLVTNSGFFFPR
jgi:hypothetical protein